MSLLMSFPARNDESPVSTVYKISVTLYLRDYQDIEMPFEHDIWSLLIPEKGNHNEYCHRTSHETRHFLTLISSRKRAYVGNLAACQSWKCFASEHAHKAKVCACLNRQPRCLNQEAFVDLRSITVKDLGGRMKFKALRRSKNVVLLK